MSKMTEKARFPRMNDSRRRLVEAFLFALGAYTEQEGKKFDQWRDQTYGQLYAHARHEIEELKRSDDLTTQLHNAADLVMLADMILENALIRNGLLDQEVEEPEKVSMVAEYAASGTQASLEGDEGAGISIFIYGKASEIGRLYNFLEAGTPGANEPEFFRGKRVARDRVKIIFEAVEGKAKERDRAERLLDHSGEYQS